MRRVLVIGGAGFIGSNLCKRLINEGCTVVALDNLMRGQIANVENLLRNEKFKFIKGDCNDVDHLINLINEYKIEHIFHLAANSDIQASAQDPQIEFESTLKSTWSILSAMRATNAKKLFFASTSAVYGEQENGEPFFENSCLKPISYYGSAKMSSEALIRSFSYMNNFDSLIYRFPNVIGPKLTHGVIFDFVNRLKKDPTQLTVLGDGYQSKPYMHVDDLIDGILHLCWTNSGVNIYNIGVKGSTSVRKIASLVIKTMNLKSCNIKYGKSKTGWKGDVPHFSYCLDKICSTGWAPKMTSDEAVKKTIEDFLTE